MFVELEKVKVYLEWIKKKLYLDSKANVAAKRVVRRGEIYLCELGFGVGSELNKTRPCVIIQNDRGNQFSSNTIVAPIRSAISDLPTTYTLLTRVHSNGDILLSGQVQLGNLVTVSKARLGNYIITLSQMEMDAIDHALEISVGLSAKHTKLLNQLNDQKVYNQKLKHMISKLRDECDLE